MKKTVLAFVAIALLSGGAATVLVRRSHRSPHTPAPSAASAPELTAPKEATSGSFVGVVLPPQAVNVASQDGGKLIRVSVKVGDMVRQGDVIASLDDAVKKHELAMARATLKTAQAQSYGAGVDLAAAREKKGRRAATVQVGDKDVPLVSGEEAATARFDERSAVSRAASASAGVHAERAHISQLAAQLDQLVLRAPFDGLVAARYADPGAFLRPGDPVARVLGAGGLRVRFAVPEEETARLAQGRAIEATVEDHTLRGTVELVAPEVEPSSRTTFAEASLDPARSECGGDCARLAGRTVRVVVHDDAPKPSALLTKPDGAETPR
jgi:RND family efflux transporter MFP subunit